MITTPNTVPPFATDGTRLDRIAADETFDGTWPFEPHFYTGNGFEQHHIDEGEGDPIVLLHGETTWGYLYRNFIPALSRTHRVIVPDHMGFGKSATPQDKEYCLRTHTLNLVGLLDSLQLDRPITLFVQDWGVLIGLHYALRFPARVARIMVGSVIPMPPILAQKIERMGGHQPAQDGRMPIEAIVAGRPELRGSSTGTPSVPITSWFPWILTGLPDDPDYVCPALHSSGPPPDVNAVDLGRRGSLFVTGPGLVDNTHDPEDIQCGATELMDAVTHHGVHIAINRRWPLREVAEAHRALGAAQTTGSTVLLPFD